jgi:uncharacterized protein
MFINREDEMRALESRWVSKKAELMVIYGRRRVGKTELIDHFISGKRGIRLLARTESEKNQLTRFSEDLAGFFSDPYLQSNPFQNWDSFFLYINEKAKSERIAIAIDEFPYLVDSNKSMPSILQDHWDRRLKDSKLFLILCGSSISMMVEKVLANKSPLYGRRTGQIKLPPMGFFEASLFFKGYSAESLIHTYSALGGTPGYLSDFAASGSFEENVRDKFLRKDSVLFQDAEFILREELKEPKFYFSILRAVALGKTKLSEIINETGLQKGVAAKYLSVLADLDIIKREVPVTEERPHKSRAGLYFLKDNFYRFWFRFVFPNIESIERGRAGEIMAKDVLPGLGHYASRIFEDVCAEWLGKSRAFDFTRIGKWWHKEHEIDIIALNEKEKKILFAECKWQEKVDAEAILSELKEKAKLVDWNKDTRKESYAIFAKSFKKKTEGAMCFDLKGIERALKGRPNLHLN